MRAPISAATHRPLCLITASKSGNAAAYRAIEELRVIKYAKGKGVMANYRLGHIVEVTDVAGVKFQLAPDSDNGGRIKITSRKRIELKVERIDKPSWGGLNRGTFWR